MQEWVKKKIIAKKSLSAVFPETKESHGSGIYLYERTDENGILWFYCGQSQDIFNRLITHAMAYDHLGLSLTKRGYKSADNPYGWELRVIEYCPIEELDEREHYHILDNMRQGKQAYNVTSGKQGIGKETFDTRKLARGYSDGIERGRKTVIKEIAHLFDLHLKVVYKADKPSKNAEKAMQKFEGLLQGYNDNDSN